MKATKRWHSESCIFNEERDASEKNYRDNWKPRRLDKDEFYEKFALPLRQGGNNHRYPGTKAQFDGLLQEEGARFLDCACGAGKLAIWLALNGKKVWAFDFSQNAIRVAKRSAELSGVADRIKFHVIDARKLKYDDNFFDVLTGKDCLHHLIKYPRAINELARVLRPGGKAYFFEPLAQNPLINLARYINICFRGYVGEHMLTKADIRMLKETFGDIRLGHHVVFSVFTRLIASTHRPLTGIRKKICIALIELDEGVLKYCPFFKRFAACSYIELVKVYD